MASAESAHPPVVRVSGRAQAELRAGEALVFDWTSLAFCCAAAGEISLRPTTLLQAQRSPAYVPLRTGDGPSVFAHRRAYPMLVGRDIQVDCRRRLGVRSFSSSLPPTSGCARRSGASPEATAGTARLPVLMLRPTDAQQEIRRTIGQLPTNEGLCDSPSKWSFRPLIGCPQLVSRIDVPHPAISQGSATAVDRVLALVRQRHQY